MSTWRIPGDHTIRKVTPAGTVSLLAGLSGVAGTADGTGTAALFGTSPGNSRGCSCSSMSRKESIKRSEK